MNINCQKFSFKVDKKYKQKNDVKTKIFLRQIFLNTFLRIFKVVLEVSLSLSLSLSPVCSIFVKHTFLDCGINKFPETYFNPSSESRPFCIIISFYQ